jgi:osmotically-inducible protein OsmY
MKNHGLIRLMIMSTVMLALTTTTVLANARFKDSELQAQAQSKLYQKKIGPNVLVKVEDGMATLSGTVASLWLKQKADKEVSRIPGISGVMNSISVDAGEVSDGKILREASRRIRGYSFYSIFDNIELKSQNGHLQLLGQVTQPWRREDIGRIVSMVSGVRAVENTLEVLPLSSYDNEIRLLLAKAIYRDPALSRYGIQPYPPIHIIVKNGNVTLTGVVNNPVEKALAERAARFAATYFSLDNQLRVESESAMAERKTSK